MNSGETSLGGQGRAFPATTMGLLAKLGASGRVEAAMVAIRLELVPTPLAGRPALASS